MVQVHEHLKFLWHNCNQDDVFKCIYCEELVIRKCECPKVTEQHNILTKSIEGKIQK